MIIEKDKELELINIIKQYIHIPENTTKVVLTFEVDNLLKIDCSYFAYSNEVEK
jgi:hypothetical protein